LNNDPLINLLYFLFGVLLNIIGIWVGIYLYLRDQKKKQQQKDDLIINNLRLIQSELLKVKDKLENLDVSTKQTVQHLLETQRQVLLQFAQSQLAESPARPLNPDLVEKLRSLRQEDEEK
jgi:hypothetical protein